MRMSRPRMSEGDPVSKLRNLWLALVSMATTAAVVYVAVAPYTDPH